MKKKKKIGRPAWGLYHIFIWINAAIMRLRGAKLKVDRSGVKDLKGPALVLCPHISLKDHVIVGLTLLPHRPTFVLSEHFMSQPFLGKGLRLLAHVISKKMFCADAGTIMGILRAKNEGNIIVLFPEGRLNGVAHSQPVAEGTAELVKKLGVPVYSVAGSGSALVYPKWGEKNRKGIIDISSSKVLTPEEIADMSVDDIQRILNGVIYHNDEEAALGREYLCKDTSKGLDGVIYKCPECMSEFTIEAGNGKVRCTECGFETELKENYRFTEGKVKTVNEWFYWQKDQLEEDTVLEDDVKIGAVGENGLMDFKAGSGHVRLTKDEFYLKGEIFNEPVEFTKETKKIGGMPYTPMREFDIYYNKKLLYIMPPDGRRIIKYVVLVDKVCEKA